MYPFRTIRIPAFSTSRCAMKASKPEVTTRAGAMEERSMNNFWVADRHQKNSSTRSIIIRYLLYIYIYIYIYINTCMYYTHTIFYDIDRCEILWKQNLNAHATTGALAAKLAWLWRYPTVYVWHHFFFWRMLFLPIRKFGNRSQSIRVESAPWELCVFGDL